MTSNDLEADQLEVSACLAPKQAVRGQSGRQSGQG